MFDLLIDERCFVFISCGFYVEFTSNNNGIYFRFYIQTFYFCSHNSLVNLIIHLKWEILMRVIICLQSEPRLKVKKIRIVVHRKFLPDSIRFSDFLSSSNLLTLKIYKLTLFLHDFSGYHHCGLRCL